MDTKKLRLIIAGLMGFYFVTVAFFLNQQGVFSTVAVLAMGRSVDDVSASHGGDIGYVTGEDEYQRAALKRLKPGHYGKPIPTKKGYVILLLHDYIKGKDYSFDEVEGVPSAKTLRDGVDIEWLYGD